MDDLYERRALFGATEASYGSIPGSLAAIEIMNAEYNRDAQQIDRQIDRSYLGANPYVNVARISTLSFDFTLLGAASPGTSAPHAPILLAAGLAETLDVSTPGSEFASYSPVSNGFDSFGGHFFMADQKCLLAGAMCDLEITAEIKNYLKAKANFTAFPGSITEEAPGAYDLSAFQDPSALETETMSLTLDGATYDAVSFSLALGNQVGMHEGSDQRKVRITDRQSGGTIRIYDPGVAAKDFFGLAESHARIAASMDLAVGSGQDVSIPITAMQLAYPKWVNIEGVRGLEFQYRALPDTGDDEFDIIFK